MECGNNTLESDHELIARGIDIWLIRSNLALSYEERVAQHQNTIDCINELHQIRFGSAKPSTTSQVSGSITD